MKENQGQRVEQFFYKNVAKWRCENPLNLEVRYLIERLERILNTTQISPNSNPDKPNWILNKNEEYKTPKAMELLSNSSSIGSKGLSKVKYG